MLKPNTSTASVVATSVLLLTRKAAPVAASVAEVLDCVMVIELLWTPRNAPERTLTAAEDCTRRSDAATASAVTSAVTAFAATVQFAVVPRTDSLPPETKSSAAFPPEVPEAVMLTAWPEMSTFPPLVTISVVDVNRRRAAV